MAGLKPYEPPLEGATASRLACGMASVEAARAAD
jgi:hypothetical protein